MKISIPGIKYSIINFRTKQYYMIFQIFQLLLAVIIIICAMTSITHFKTPYIMYMQFILLLTMAIDLLVIRYISQGGFRSITKGLTGKVDLGIFIVFSLTLIFLALNQDQDEDQILQTDDIIIILIVISRYSIQIYRMVTGIKQTKQTRELNKEIKEIDLNINTNLSNVYHKEMDNQNNLTKKIADNFKSKEKNELVEDED